MYVYGPEIDEPLRMERGGQKYYYHAAALGTVTEITDDTGALVEQYRYDVYGEPEFRNGSGTLLSGSAIGNRLLFQGRDRDPDTGLYNFRHRYYSPALGRFLQPDPIGKPHFETGRLLLSIDLLDELGIGSPDDPTEGVQPNETSLYTFLRNSSNNYSDPLGLAAKEKIEKIKKAIEKAQQIRDILAAAQSGKGCACLDSATGTICQCALNAFIKGNAQEMAECFCIPHPDIGGDCMRAALKTTKAIIKAKNDYESVK